MSTLTASASAVPMPRLSDSMEEGTIVAWLQEPGATVARGEALCEIETDKATMVYESDLEGPLTIVAAVGETVAVGTLIAYVGEPPAGDGEVEPTSEPEVEATAEVAPEPQVEAVAGPGSGRVPATPVARRIAAERGLSLVGRSGRGPGGRIRKADVLGWLEGEPQGAPALAEQAPPPAPPEGVEAVELSRVQTTIARRMADAQATVPDFQVTIAVAMDEAALLRERLREALPEGDPVPSFNDFAVKAAGLALRRHPRVNGSYVGGRFELHSRVNVCIAVAAEDALLTPVIEDADRLALGALAARSRALAERARAGAITPPELAGGTFTISNLGMFGVESFSAIVNMPQAAILAVGAIATEPVVRGGELGVGKVMRMTLSCDHRILYGADAAAFLADLRELLENPLQLLL